MSGMVPCGVHLVLGTRLIPSADRQLLIHLWERQDISATYLFINETLGVGVLLVVCYSCFLGMAERVRQVHMTCVSTVWCTLHPFCDLEDAVLLRVFFLHNSKIFMRGFFRLWRSISITPTACMYRQLAENEQSRWCDLCARHWWGAGSFAVSATHPVSSLYSYPLWAVLISCAVWLVLN